MMSLIVSLVILCAVIGMVARDLIVLTRAQKRVVTVQARLVESLRTEGNRHPWWRIVLVRPAYLRRRFVTVVPYELIGLAIQEPDALRIVAEWPNGERFGQKIAYRTDEIEVYDKELFATVRAPSFSIGRGEAAWRITVVERDVTGVQESGMDLFRQIAAPERVPSRQKSEPSKRIARLLIVTIFAVLVLSCFIGSLFYPTHGVNSLVYKQAIFGKEFLIIHAISFFAACFGFVNVACRFARAPAPLAFATANLFAMVAFYGYLPAALYLDEVFATESPRVVVYCLQKKTKLSPVETDLPDLEFISDRAYWAQFPVGSQHEFIFQHGALGLWQHKAEAYERRKRTYFDSHPEARRSD